MNPTSAPAKLFDGNSSVWAQPGVCGRPNLPGPTEQPGGGTVQGLRLALRLISIPDTGPMQACSALWLMRDCGVASAREQTSG